MGLTHQHWRYIWINMGFFFITLNWIMHGLMWSNHDIIMVYGHPPSHIIHENDWWQSIHPIPYHPSLLMAGIFHSYVPETMGKWIDDHPQPLPVDPMWSCIMFHIFHHMNYTLNHWKSILSDILYYIIFFLKLHHVFSGNLISDPFWDKHR